MTGGIMELSWLSLLLLVGIIVSIIAIKIKLPDLILLILVGMLAGYAGLTFNPSFLTAFAVFALVMIIFESSSKFKPREINQLSPLALRLAGLFFLLNIIFLTGFTNILFFKSLEVNIFLVCGVFGALMAGTSPDVVLSVFKGEKKKIAEILEFESILNTPLTVLIPIVILEMYQGIFQASDILIKLLQSVMAGIGAGLVIGIVIFRFLKKFYLETLSPLVVIAAALISYTLAEIIGGNGVLAVTTLGVVFGLSLIKEKLELEKFVSIFTNFLKIVVFILLGIIIKIPLNPAFIFKSFLLFLVYLLIRFLTVHLVFLKTKIKNREKIFMTLNVSKGVAVAVVAFIMASLIDTIQGLNIVLDLTFLFILYSIVLATITKKFTPLLLQGKEEILKKKK